MKKRTNEEKARMINEACDLYNEAKERLKEAKRLLHLCGIEICGGFEEGDIEEWDIYGRNVHIYSGIKKMSELVGVGTYFHKDCMGVKTDNSVCFLKHKGLVFLQSGKENTRGKTTYTFR